MLQHKWTMKNTIKTINNVRLPENKKSIVTFMKGLNSSEADRGKNQEACLLEQKWPDRSKKE